MPGRERSVAPSRSVLEDRQEDVRRPWLVVVRELRLASRPDPVKARIAHLERLTSMRSRLQTYRSHDRAYRAFYRWVAKEHLYERLIAIPRPWGTQWIRAGGGGLCFGSAFRHGYPIFGVNRSEAMKQWDNRFQVHRDRWQAELDHIDRTYGLTESERHWKADLAQDQADDARNFFILAAAAASLHEHLGTST